MFGYIWENNKGKILLVTLLTCLAVAFIYYVDSVELEPEPEEQTELIVTPKKKYQVHVPPKKVPLRYCILGEAVDDWMVITDAANWWVDTVGIPIFMGDLKGCNLPFRVVKKGKPNAGLTWNGKGEIFKWRLSYDKTIPQEEKLQVFIYMFGKALGLKDDTGINSVMNPNFRKKIFGVSKKDKKLLRDLFGYEDYLQSLME